MADSGKRFSQERDRVAHDPVERVEEFVVGLEFSELRVRIVRGEGPGELDGNDSIADAVEDLGGLAEVGIAGKSAGILEKAEVDSPELLRAIVIDRRPPGLPPAPNRLVAVNSAPTGLEPEGGREQDKPVDFRVGGGVESGQIAAHRGPDQAAGSAVQRVFDDSQL